MDGWNKYVWMCIMSHGNIGSFSWKRYYKNKFHYFTWIFFMIGRYDVFYVENFYIAQIWLITK